MKRRQRKCLQSAKQMALKPPPRTARPYWVVAVKHGRYGCRFFLKLKCNSSISMKIDLQIIFCCQLSDVAITCQNQWATFLEIQWPISNPQFCCENSSHHFTSKLTVQTVVKCCILVLPDFLFKFRDGFFFIWELTLSHLSDTYFSSQNNNGILNSQTRLFYCWKVIQFTYIICALLDFHILNNVALYGDTNLPQNKPLKYTVVFLWWKSIFGCKGNIIF